jgi:hypothetical protein
VCWFDLIGEPAQQSGRGPPRWSRAPGSGWRIRHDGRVGSCGQHVVVDGVDGEEHARGFHGDDLDSKSIQWDCCPQSKSIQKKRKRL